MDQLTDGIADQTIKDLHRAFSRHISIDAGGYRSGRAPV